MVVNHSEKYKSKGMIYCKERIMKLKKEIVIFKRKEKFHEEWQEKVDAENQLGQCFSVVS